MLEPEIILVTGEGCSLSRGGTISSGLRVNELPRDGTREAFLVRGTLNGSSAGEISKAGLMSPRAELGSGDAGGNLKLPSDGFLLSLAAGVFGAVLCLEVRLLGLGLVGMLLSVCALPRRGGELLKKGEGCNERALLGAPILPPRPETTCKLALRPCPLGGLLGGAMTPEPVFVPLTASL